LKLADLADHLYGQPMFELLVKANLLQKTKKIIHYEIGDPSFSTPRNVIEKTIEALENGHTHYVASKGVDACCEAVRRYVEKYYGFNVSNKQVVICTANTAIDFICRLTANPGDEIIYPNPGFPTYYSCIAYNGFVPVALPLTKENGYVMKAQELERLISAKTKLIILNSAQNPTGSLMTQEEVKAIFEVAEKYNIFILSDEVYARFIYEGDFYSPAQYDFCRERVILLGSVSKTYAMTGWRLGYVVCPETIAEKLALMIQTVLSCMPNFLQYGMIEALSGEQTVVEDRLEELKRRRNRLISGLNEIEGIVCPMPKAAFYAFPNIEKVCIDDKLYCEKLLEKKGICVIPGSYFGEYGRGHVRMCYASVGLEEIDETVQLLKEFHYNRLWES